MGELYQKIQKRLEIAEKYQKKDGRVQRWDRLYEKLGGKYYKDRELKDRIKVETIAAYVYQALPTILFQNPYINVQAKTPKFVTSTGQITDNIRNADLAEAVINQEIKEIHLKKQMAKVVQDVLCPYDFGVVKVGYSYTTNIDFEGYENVIEDSVWAYRICPRDVFVSPMSTGEDLVRHVFHRLWKPLQWVKDNPNFDKVMRQKVQASGTPWNLKKQNSEYINDMELVEIYEYHDYETGEISIFSKGTEDFLIPPFKDPYEFKGPHFCFFNPFPMNDDFFGRSISGMIECQADEKNKLRTRALGIIKKFPIINFYQKGSWTVAQQKEWADADDACNCEVNDINGIRTQTVPGIPQDFYRMLELLERDEEKQAGTSSMRRGEVTPVKPTIAQIITGHENMRDMYMRDQVAELYKEVSSKLIDLMIQYYDKPKWVKLSADSQLMKETGSPFALYRGEDIAGNYDFEIDVVSMTPLANEQKAQVLSNTLTQAMNIPPIAEELLKTYDMGKVLKDVVKMQGVDMEKYKREMEPENQNDPSIETDFALKGGLLENPARDEDHAGHLRVHEPAANITGNPELIRHTKIHQAYMQQIQAEKQAQMQAQGQLIPPPQMAMPPQAPQGVPQQGNAVNMQPVGPIM